MHSEEHLQDAIRARQPKKLAAAKPPSQPKSPATAPAPVPSPSAAASAIGTPMEMGQNPRLP